jgi:hypothetical protein
MHRLKFILFGIALVLGIATVGFLVWAETPLAPMPESIALLQSDSQVQVNEAGWIVFQPVNADPDTGLIIYPGGRVDPRAYAPIAHAIAQQGYLVVIVPMPLNLAVLGVDRAKEVMAAYPEIQHWAIGGHSLGGAMAAHFAYKHPHLVQGLLLWAAYPPKSDDLSGQSLKTVSILGSLDGLGTAQGVEKTRHLLPQETQYLVIQGGNHAQFGSYGKQPGDAEAAIPRSDQQAQAVRATLDLLANLK